MSNPFNDRLIKLLVARGVPGPSITMHAFGDGDAEAVEISGVTPDVAQRVAKMHQLEQGPVTRERDDGRVDVSFNVREQPVRLTADEWGIILYGIEQSRRTHGSLVESIESKLKKLVEQP